MGAQQAGKWLALGLGMALLAACGGGGDGGGGSGGGGSAPSATGTLTDGPVGGVSYSTSGGYSGTTDASGHFRYNPGETVTFRIGELVLGAVTPSGTGAVITPIQIADASGLGGTARDNLVTNLLVLLQSLDGDGDASNGITIPAAAATALTSAVAGNLDLKKTPDDFVADSHFTGVVAAAGGAAVTPAAAQEHFRAQFLKDLAGVHLLQNDEGVIAFRFNDDGRYLMGEVGEADAAGQTGIEIGRIDWSPTTGEISATITMDSNGEWGLSHIVDERIVLSLDGGNLVATVTDTESGESEVLAFTRVAQGSGVTGIWALDDGSESVASNLGRPQFIFRADGHYLMLDPVGDDDVGPDETSCGGPGLELGRYTLNNGVFTASGIIADTNGCAGLHDDDSGTYSTFAVVFNDNDTQTWTIAGEGEFTLKRISTQAASSSSALVFAGTATASNDR